MTDWLRAVLILCAGIEAWAVTDNWRGGALAVCALMALAPWRD